MVQIFNYVDVNTTFHNDVGILYICINYCFPSMMVDNIID